MGVEKPVREFHLHRLF